MDEVREKKPGRRRGTYLISTVTISLFFWGCYALWAKAGDVSVSRATLVMDEVRRGSFEVLVSGSGSLVPLRQQLLTARSSGRVVEVVVKAGDPVKTGDLIARLANEAVERDAREGRLALETARAETKILETRLRSELLTQNSAVLSRRFDLQVAQTRYEAEKRLMSSGAGPLSTLDFERSRLTVEQLQAQVEIETSRIDAFRENVTTQVEAQRARMKLLQQGVESKEALVVALEVRAPIDGVVQELTVEAGKFMEAGAVLAKVSQNDVLMAAIKVQETDMRDVALGQAAVIDTRSSTVAGSVVRIDPAVKNGTVQIDVELTGPLPKGARPELAVDGRIRVAQLDDVLYMARPAFVSGVTSLLMYRLEPQTDVARRVSVELGRHSVDKVEIIAGLRAGDQVIVSDTSRWNSYASIRIKR